MVVAVVFWKARNDVLEEIMGNGNASEGGPKNDDLLRGRHDSRRVRLTECNNET